MLGSLKIGRHLAPDHPFIQLLPPVDRTTNHATAITELADHCIRLIRAIQPHGPYCLSGYSIGAIVALEIAPQLDSQRAKVVFLALIDPDPPRPFRKDFFMRNAHREGLGAALRAQFARVRARLGRAIAPCSREEAQDPIAAGYREFSAERKVFTFPGVYRASACPCPLTLLISDGPEGSPPHPSFMDERLDWRNVARHGCDVHPIPGDHLTMNQEPHVRILADRLRECLAKVLQVTTLLSIDAQFLETLGSL